MRIGLDSSPLRRAGPRNNGDAPKCRTLQAFFTAPARGARAGALWAFGLALGPSVEDGERGSVDTLTIYPEVAIELGTGPRVPESVHTKS